MYFLSRATAISSHRRTRSKRVNSISAEGIRLVQGWFLLTLALEIHAFLEPDAGELLVVQVFDDRQDELDAFLVGRQPFVFQVLLELLHVLRPDAEYVQRFQQTDMRRLG